MPNANIITPEKGFGIFASGGHGLRALATPDTNFFKTEAEARAAIEKGDLLTATKGGILCVILPTIRVIRAEPEPVQEPVQEPVTAPAQPQPEVARS